MFKVFVAFWIVLGAIIWGQHYAATWITQQAADLPPQDVLPTSTVVIPHFDPSLSRSFNTPGFMHR